MSTTVGNFREMEAGQMGRENAQVWRGREREREKWQLAGRH